jgi:hypothetical protein
LLLKITKFHKIVCFTVKRKMMASFYFSDFFPFTKLKRLPTFANLQYNDLDQKCPTNNLHTIVVMLFALQLQVSTVNTIKSDWRQWTFSYRKTMMAMMDIPLNDGLRPKSRYLSITGRTSLRYWFVDTKRKIIYEILHFCYFDIYLYQIKWYVLLFKPHISNPILTIIT